MSAEMPFLNVSFRAMAHATEDLDSVQEALVFASGSRDIETGRAEGHFGNEIIVLETRLERNRQIRNFMARLQEAGIIDELEAEVTERMDHDCVLHLRLDKQLAFGEELALAREKDVIDVCIKTAAYPAKRQNALENLREWLHRNR